MIIRLATLALVDPVESSTDGSGIGAAAMERAKPVRHLREESCGASIALA